jgi:hypothetical protein
MRNAQKPRLAEARNGNTESGSIVGFSLQFFANPGQTWRLEASDTLAPGSWISLVTFLVGDDWTVDFMDAAGLTRSNRFYRAVSP